MVAGHLGIALGTRRFTRAVPFWLLLIAAELPDWLDACVCVIAPSHFAGEMWSHSIPAVLTTAAVIGSLYLLWRSDWSGAAALAFLVVSHVAADYLTGYKPTWPGGPVIGFGLYSHPIIDTAVEIGVVTLGWLLYRETLPDERRSTRLGVLPLVLLVAGQLSTMVAALTGVIKSKC